MTVKRSCRAAARGAPMARSLNAPTTRMTGGPSPDRSKAVSSLERTLAMYPSPSTVRRFAIVQLQHTEAVPSHNGRVSRDLAQAASEYPVRPAHEPREAWLSLHWCLGASGGA